MYKQIKNFPQYECDGANVRNITTKKPQKIKKGTEKYYLLNASGMRKLISLSQFEYNADNIIKQVLASSAPKIEQVKRLLDAGLSREEVRDLTGTTLGNIARAVWAYKSGRRKL